jgi:hypothetical protein
METRIQAIGNTLDKFPVNLKPDAKAIEASQAGSALSAAIYEAAAAQPSAMEVVSSRRRYRQVSLYRCFLVMPVLTAPLHSRSPMMSE